MKMLRCSSSPDENACLTPRAVRSGPRPVQKVWGCLEKLLFSLYLGILGHRGVPWLCRWTSTSTRIEPSSLDLRQQRSGTSKTL